MGGRLRRKGSKKWIPGEQGILESKFGTSDPPGQDFQLACLVIQCLLKKKKAYIEKQLFKGIFLGKELLTPPVGSFPEECSVKAH